MLCWCVRGGRSLVARALGPLRLFLVVPGPVTRPDHKCIMGDSISYRIVRDHSQWPNEAAKPPLPEAREMSRSVRALLVLYPLPVGRAAGGWAGGRAGLVAGGRAGVQAGRQAGGQISRRTYGQAGGQAGRQPASQASGGEGE